jgi:hypothetical protein
MEVWSATGRNVPASLTFNYNGGRRKRYGTVTVYTGLYISESKGKKYLSARKKEVQDHFTAPIGALVFANFQYGSRKHTYFEYGGWFIVEEGSEIEEAGDEYELTATNLRKLEMPTKKQVVEAEARILNAGLIPSSFAPVKSIVHILNLNEDLLRSRSKFNLTKVSRSDSPRPPLSPAEVLKKLLEERPEVLEELGYSVENVKALLSNAGTRRSTRQKRVVRLQ